MGGSIDVVGLSGFQACLWEVTARKVGNVHRNADFDDTTYLDFITSASLIKPYLCQAGSKEINGGFTALAVAIGNAIGENSMVVKRNTNLGIILLLFPLAAAWHRLHQEKKRKNCLDRLLARLTVEDAVYVYRSIRLARPGGLGDAPEQDVSGDPTVTLLEAMKLAADRDLVARQYATGFADVFDFGVPAFLAGFERFGSVEAAIIDSQLRWLAAYPDSLIARKNGPAVAADVQARAAAVLDLGGIATPDGRRAGVALDRHLRSDGNKLNPGTTADLITACLFVALRENKVSPSTPFRWHTDEWL
jgi:triphosphoribosyl-dephospho-CoA synthase